MVSADQLRASGYDYDNDVEKWVKGSSSMSTGDVIKFDVDKIHECDGTISLEGSKPTLKLLVEQDI